MKTLIVHEDITYEINLDDGNDISIPSGQVNCFYAPPYVSEPHTEGDFTGSVKKGAPVNFFNVFLNPHGHGTHTECVGHITVEQETISETLEVFHFVADLITVNPHIGFNGDRIISSEDIQAKIKDRGINALIVRTLPNNIDKLVRDYSGTNPAYFSPRAMEYIVGLGIRHLLVDVPSVDREDDGGLLLCHKSFWQLQDGKRSSSTITELIYVPNRIPDGRYFLNLQVAPFNLDAAPSRPVIYHMHPIVKV